MKLWVKYFSEGGFEDKPKGWTDKSIKKSAKTLSKTIGVNSPKSKGFFDKCVSRMSKHMGDGAKGYCASLKDETYGSTFWRGKNKSKKEIGKKVRLNKNV